MSLKVSRSNGLLACMGRLSISPTATGARILPSQQTRLASHASQGVANKAKQGAGKRLGAKKGDSELVVPGNIIFRQRGSHWHPGENCVMGRDHTISSLVKGYVRYYRDPALHKTRKYIGVVFEQEERLPRHPSAPRRRRLAMEASPIADAIEPEQTEDVNEQIKDAIRYGVGRRLQVNEQPDVAIREGYQVRESYRSIGRTAEREGVTEKIAYFDRVNWQARLKRRIEGRKTAHKRRRTRR